MSLWIEVYVGGKTNRIKVAECVAHNVSELNDLSDYTFTAEEFGAPHLNIPARIVQDKIKSHERKSSVWALIEKISYIAKGGA